MSSLERALVDLGRQIRYEEADLSPAVLDRLWRLAPTLSARPRRAVVVAAATVAVLVGGLAVASPGVRAALVRTLVLPGLRIVVGQPEPRAPVQRVGQDLELGEAVSLEEAQAAVGFPLRVPAALGAPDRVFLEADRVWFVYRPAPGIPRAHETGVGVLVAQIDANIDDQLLKKVQFEADSVQPVQVRGREGYWIRGAHTLFLLDDRGSVIEERTRIAGNVLVWEQGGVTYRVESALGLEASLRVAESFA